MFGSADVVCDTMQAAERFRGSRRHTAAFTSLPERMVTIRNGYVTQHFRICAADKMFRSVRQPGVSADVRAMLRVGQGNLFRFAPECSQVVG